MQALRFLCTLGSSFVRTVGSRLNARRQLHQSRSTAWANYGIERLEARQLLSAQLVYDFQPSDGDSRIDDLTVVGATVYFTASDAIHGAELWKSDGTAAGTEIVKDIQPGPAGSFPSQLTHVNGTLYFRANGRLWKTDGSLQRTVPIHSQAGDGPLSPGELTALDGTLYFRAFDGLHGMELWRSDGTPSGTFRVRDLHPGLSDSNPREFTVLGRRMYFISSLGASRYALFRSDGTETGTVLVKTINSGLRGTPPSKLVTVEDALYFTSFDVRNGARLWKSDGTEAGTVAVAAGFTDVQSHSLDSVGDQLYFTAFDPIHGWELWKSNGATAGTRIVRDIEPGSSGSFPNKLMQSDGTLFFTAATTTSGRELWTTNGTANGTRLVRDINPGPESAAPDGLRDIGGVVLFAADDGMHGMELWRSDATAEGTRLFLDMNPGRPGSSPTEFQSLNGSLLFAADDGSRGPALWSSVEAVPGTPIPQAPLGVATFQYPTFHWSAAEGAVAYDLWVNDVTTGRSGIIRNPQVPENRFTTPVQLENGHTFLWTVRAVGRFGTVGEWAPHQSFRVDSRVAAPNLIGPRGTVSASSPTFTWTPVFGADRYDVWVNDLTTGETGIIRNAFVRGPIFAPLETLPSNHAYIWTVRGIDRFGTPGRWAAHQVFYTVSILPAPELISPIANIRSDGRPEFTWTPVTGAARYDIWVNDLTTGESGVIRHTHVPHASFTPGEALPTDHRFIWTVRAINANGTPGEWAVHRVFTLTSFLAPVLYAPPTAAGTSRPTFTWSEVPHAARYDLWLNDLTTGQSAVIRHRQIMSTRFTAPFDLTRGHRYIWTVRAIDGNDEPGPWAPHRTFRLAAAEDVRASADDSAVSRTVADGILTHWPSIEWWNSNSG